MFLFSSLSFQTPESNKYYVDTLQACAHSFVLASGVLLYIKKKLYASLYRLKLSVLNTVWSISQGYNKS